MQAVLGLAGMDPRGHDVADPRQPLVAPFGDAAQHHVPGGHDPDQAVRVAMRIMEERVTLVERMPRDARETGRLAVAELYDTRAEEYRRSAGTLRQAALSSLRMGASRPQDI